VEKLKDICEIVMGQSPDSNSYNEKQDGLPFYQGNADFGVVNPKTRYWCNAPTKIAVANDVLLSVRAPIGAVNIATEKCCIGRGLVAIREKEGTSFYKHLYYLIISKNKKLNLLGTGSTFKAINKSNLENIEILLPTLPEQQRIAGELDIVCGILAKQKRQYKLFERLIKSKFNQLFGDPVTNPMGWAVVEIGEVAKLEGGYAFSSKDYKKSGVKIIKITNVTKDILDWSEVEYVSKVLAEKCKRFLVKEGDLLMAMTRPIIKSLEAVKIAKATEGDLPALVNQRVGRFVIDDDRLSAAFLLEFCKHPLFKSQIEKFGSNSLQPNVSSRQVESILIMLPSLDLQNQFADFVAQVEKSKVKLKAEIEQTETLYKALMQKYFGDKEMAA